MARSVSIVDLFCGVGGLTHGLVREKFNVVAGVDIDASCRYGYERNNPGAKFHELSISTLTGKQLSALYPIGDTKILVGCAPCQPFSPYTNGSDWERKWKLLYKFAALIRHSKPDIVSMENVPELSKHGVFDFFVSSLMKENYDVWYGNVNCVLYGVPQTRVRLVLLASKLGPIKLVPETHTFETRLTVRKTIEGLERLEAGQSSKSDPLHRASALSPLNQRRIATTPAGGSWKDWPEELRLKCHKKESGKSYGSVYGRMPWDEPAPTMTTQCNGLGNGRFGHPDQHRAISLREAALFQTFPPEYEFFDPNDKISLGSLSRHIGNAVPVRLGEIIAQSIRQHLDEHPD
ncbi:MAG: DNA cytosine methyltransferase [Janthinobacterium lividum]